MWATCASGLPCSRQRTGSVVAAVMRVQEQLQEQRLLLLVQLVKLMPQLRPV